MTTAIAGTQGTANPFTALSASAGGAAGGAESSGGATQDRFMTLLIAQMKNQDPLNPMDNAQVTSQLAQIDTVKGIDQLNQTLQKLVGNSDSAQAVQAAGLVGHTALVAGKSIELTAEGGMGGFELGQPAEDVNVTITDPSGQIVHRASLGALPSGVHSFAWDGKTDAGVAASPGAYSFSVSALSGGKTTGVDALAALRIDGVRPGQGAPTLQMRGVGTVQMNQIKQIF